MVDEDVAEAEDGKLFNFLLKPGKGRFTCESSISGRKMKKAVSKNGQGQNF